MKSQASSIMHVLVQYLNCAQRVHKQEKSWQEWALGSIIMAIMDIKSFIKSLISRQLPREPLLIATIFSVISSECVDYNNFSIEVLMLNKYKARGALCHHHYDTQNKHYPFIFFYYLKSHINYLNFATRNVAECLKILFLFELIQIVHPCMRRAEL